MGRICGAFLELPLPHGSVVSRVGSVDKVREAIPPRLPKKSYLGFGLIGSWGLWSMAPMPWGYEQSAAKFGLKMFKV